VSNQLFNLTYQNENEERLDKFLTGVLQDYSRNRLQGLIKDGFVKVNGVVISKSGTILENGDTLEVNIPASQPTELIPEDIPLQIVFENKDLIVINKPAGMVVHPSAGHGAGTLVHAALAHLPEIEGVGGEQRPGVVHRLDKDTSGLILFAKNDKAHQWLQEQFRLRIVKKVYLALVDGKPPTAKGRIEAPVGRDPSHRKKMAITPPEKGRESVTEYFTLEQFTSHTYLEVHPLTGRTHQIRIHMAFLGCPIVGDTLYGRRKSSLPINRHFLHAARITINLPGENKPVTFEAPLPTDLEQLLSGLR
jgi:23S rRNA pseudouridine1911/1915/1917 synthase